MSNVEGQSLKGKNMIFDLEERTAKFGEEIIRFVKMFSRNIINDVLTRQLVRSATSIGANYMEADGAESKRDFRHKISLCKKEAKESQHWLRMIETAIEDPIPQIKQLRQEAKELALIFSSIARKC